MENILAVLWVLIEDLFFLVFLSAFFTKKKNRIKVFLAYAILCLTQSVLMPVCPAQLRPFVTTFLAFCVSLYLFDGKWGLKLALCVFASFVLALMDTVSIYGMSAALGLPYHAFVMRMQLYATVVTAEKLIALFFAWLFRHFWHSGGVKGIQRKWLFLLLLFPTVSIGILMVLFFQAQDQPDLSIGTVALCGGLAVANIGILFVIRTLEASTRKEQEDLLLRRQMDLQAENILALEKSYRAQRQNVHEFRHHLQTLQTLLEENQVSKAQEYLNTLRETQTVRVFSVRSGHSILDVVLNEKYQAAQEKDIAMQIQVNDLSALSLPTDALVVLLSNLLDNAIEAAEQCQGHREIQCSLQLKDSFYLSVRNSSHAVTIVDGYIATTKAEKLDHGYGLIAVRKILDGWKAEYTFEYKDGWFQFAAEIPL